jgi:hypothetical protein
MVKVALIFQVYAGLILMVIPAVIGLTIGEFTLTNIMAMCIGILSVVLSACGLGALAKQEIEEYESLM